MALSVFDSFARVQFDRFREMVRVFCSLAFYQQNTTSLDQSKNKSPFYGLRYVNKHRFLLPKLTAFLLFPKLE